MIVTLNGEPTMKDNIQKSKTKLVYTVEINASKAEAWKILADFSNLDWTLGVTGSHYLNDKRACIGMTRHCDLVGNKYIVERITRWDEGIGFTYILDEASDPVTNDSYVTWQLNGNDAKSTATFEVNYQLKYGIIGKIMNVLMAKKKFTKQITEFMGEFKKHVEAQVNQV